MATNRKDPAINIDSLKALLAEHPEVLQEALKSTGVKPVGLPAYTVIGKEERMISFCKTEGTRIVRGEPEPVTCYIVRTLNGNVVSIPEYDLAVYGIRTDGNVPMVDDDGLTNRDKQEVLENGAY